MGCNVSSARRSRPAGTPPSRPRTATRQSAASKMTRSTATTTASTVATESQDGRTSILMYGRAHEDPLRCNPVPPAPLGGGDEGEDEDCSPPPVRPRQRRNAHVSWEKRAGMVFHSTDDTHSFWGGSTRRGTEVEGEDKQDKVEELSRSIAVQTDEAPHDLEPLEVDTST